MRLYLIELLHDTGFLIDIMTPTSHSDLIAVGRSDCRAGRTQVEAHQGSPVTMTLLMGLEGEAQLFSTLLGSPVGPEN